MIVWPSDLPLDIDQSGFGLSRPEGRLRSKTSTGPGKSRRISTAAPALVSASMVLSTNDVARFERFYEEELLNGTLPFVVADKRYDGQPLTTSEGDNITCPDGNTMLLDGNVIPATEGGDILISAYVLARFGETVPQLSAVTGDLYRYAMQIEFLS